MTGLQPCLATLRRHADKYPPGVYINLMEYGYTEEKQAYLRRLKRIEGQVRGIARMVEDEKYCIDILTQVAAANKALHAVSIGLLQEHIRHCVVDAAEVSSQTGNPEVIEAKVNEATAAISRLIRS